MHRSTASSAITGWGSDRPPVWPWLQQARISPLRQQGGPLRTTEEARILALRAVCEQTRVAPFLLSPWCSVALPAVSVVKALLAGAEPNELDIEMWRR